MPASEIELIRALGRLRTGYHKLIRNSGMSGVRGNTRAADANLAQVLAVLAEPTVASAMDPSIRSAYDQPVDFQLDKFLSLERHQTKEASLRPDLILSLGQHHLKSKVDAEAGRPVATVEDLASYLREVHSAVLAGAARARGLSRREKDSAKGRLLTLVEESHGTAVLSATNPGLPISHIVVDSSVRAHRASAPMKPAA